MKTKVLYPYTTRPRDAKLHMMLLLQVPGPNAVREGREVAVKEKTKILNKGARGDQTKVEAYNPPLLISLDFNH